MKIAPAEQELCAARLPRSLDLSRVVLLNYLIKRQSGDLIRDCFGWVEIPKENITQESGELVSPKATRHYFSCK